MTNWKLSCLLTVSTVLGFTACNQAPEDDVDPTRQEAFRPPVDPPRTCRDARGCDVGEVCRRDPNDPCLPPPDCTGRICTAVCANICHPAFTTLAAGCDSNADCGLVQDHCAEGCVCLAVGAKQERPRLCPPGTSVNSCVVDPCLGKSAVCQNHQCVVDPVDG